MLDEKASKKALPYDNGHVEASSGYNDLDDAMHAAGALAYCDVFFTERSLARRIEADVRGQVPTECQVEYRPDAALALVERLLS